MGSVAPASLALLGAALAVLLHAPLGFPGIMCLLPPSLRVPCFALAKFIVFGFWATVAVAGTRALELMAGDALVTLPWLPMQLVQSALPVAAKLIIMAELLDAPERLGLVRRGIDDETQ